MPGGVDRRIVILDIDEKSLGELGRWPWNRALMADLNDKLFERYGVAAVGYDVVWAERDASSGIDVLDQLARRELKDAAGFQDAYGKLRPGLDYDGLFAASLKGRAVVLGYYFNGDERAVRANALPPAVLPRGSFEGRRVEFPRWHGYTGNLPAYLANATGAGHVNPLVDFDGVLRRVPLILEFDGEYYESLSLAMARTLVAAQTGRLPSVEPGFPQGGPDLEWLRIGPIEVPVDPAAAALVPYRGPKYSFPYVSLADVVRGRAAPELLRGKVALVGSTAPGLQDLRSTPVDNVYPGVEIHANLIAGMIDHAIKQRPLYVVGAEVVLLALIGVALAVLIPVLPALWASFAAAAGVALATGVNLAAWSAGLVLPLAGAVMMVAALYTLNMAYGYVVESRSKRQFAELFGQYVPPELVGKMAEDPGRYTMAPRSAELSILFSDVRGFTGISEALSPDALREYIDEYLTAMSVIIRSRYRGTLDKYIGDAIMAFWGAPVEDPHHARNAVLAALAMQKECAALNARFAARGWPELRIGIGVNSGPVRVGDMGSRLRRAYTAMGDAVNVASRLEGRTKYYGVGILVGEATRRLAEGLVFREVDSIKVKGKDAAVRVYEPLEQPPGERETSLWAEALAAYRDARWDDAGGALAELRLVDPACGLYAAYAERVARLREAPPAPGWDGVTVFDEK